MTVEWWLPKDNNLLWRLATEKTWDCINCWVSDEVLGYYPKKNKDKLEENDIEIQKLIAKIRSRNDANLVQTVKK